MTPSKVMTPVIGPTIAPINAVSSSFSFGSLVGVGPEGVPVEGGASGLIEVLEITRLVSRVVVGVEVVPGGEVVGELDVVVASVAATISLLLIKIPQQPEPTARQICEEWI